MAKARLDFTEDAWEDWQDLDRSAQRAVAKALMKLEIEPDKRGEPLGSRAAGSLTNFRKLKAGARKEYRVVYRVAEDGTVVVIWVLGPRANDEAYKLARARLAMHPNPAIRTLAAALMSCGTADEPALRTERLTKAISATKATSTRRSLATRTVHGSRRRSTGCRSKRWVSSSAGVREVVRNLGAGSGSAGRGVGAVRRAGDADRGGPPAARPWRPSGGVDVALPAVQDH